MTTMHSIERAKERVGINARAAEHLMKNYLDFGKCGGGRWKRYLYLDTEDFLLGSLLTREQVKVKFETCLMRDNEKYRMVMMKVQKRDETKFMKALEELPGKMLLCGYRDYETHGGELLAELEELIRADMEAHGKIRLPMGGTARVELG